MKILITGNLGYVGPGVVKEFRINYPDAEIVGFDVGYFAKYITSNKIIPESYLDTQYYGDVRQFPDSLLKGVDTIVVLAAISNDPIGNKYEEVTLDINYRSAIEMAKKAKQSGVKNYIFASSCSVYGSAGDEARTEDSELNPLTAYAKSKVFTENELAKIADKDFMVTCLRFATACGMSERLRLDLVLNDFVAGAVVSGEINILSDGAPWRPLINVLDMARAIRWAHERTPSQGGDFLIVNTGSDEWNYRVKELALKVQSLLPNTKVSVNHDAQPDKRSYRVNFGLFKKLAPDHQPIHDLERTIKDLLIGLKEIDFKTNNFRNSDFMRLNIISKLAANGIIDEHLRLVQ